MNCGTMTDLRRECTEDAFLGGRLRLRQLKSGHRAGHDAMLLAAATSVLAGLSRSNAAANAIAADVIVLDVASGAEAFAAAGLAPDSADFVLMNPPFNDSARHRASPDATRASA